jgi:hypothetical protein
MSAVPSIKESLAARDRWESWKGPMITALNLCDGPVLEIGMGHYSTPFLHSYCEEDGRRRLVSLEDHAGWMAEYAHHETSWHRLVGGSYDQTIPTMAMQKWGVVFLDESPGELRGHHLAEFLRQPNEYQADFIIVHDFHDAVKAAIEPLLATDGLNWRVYQAQEPATLVVSKLHKLNFAPDFS